MKRYIAIAVMDGDGNDNEAGYGTRIWSETFTTKAAADRAASFVQSACKRTTVIEDEA